MPISNGRTECRRCSQDKYLPELYSGANNMNPGRVPIQLQVRLYLVNLLIHLFYTVDTLT